MSKDDPAAVVKNALARIIFLTLLLGCWMALRRVTEFRLQRLLRVALVLFCWFDVFTHTANLSPTVERGVYEPDSIRQYFKWDVELRPGESRAFETAASMNWISIHAISDPAADLNGRRLGLYENFNLLDHAAKVDGFYSLELREMSRLTRVIYGATNEFPKLADFMGVARISNPTNLVDWLPRDTFMPMITGGQEPVFADDDSAARGILSAGFDPRQTVYLEPAAQSQTMARQADVKIISKSVAAQQINAQVEASAPAMVVVAQSFYHCWKAYVDGKPARLWRANYAFQAIEMPAGKHELRLAYEDAAFYYGAIISLSALVVPRSNVGLAGKILRAPGLISCRHQWI